MLGPARGRGFPQGLRQSSVHRTRYARATSASAAGGSRVLRTRLRKHAPEPLAANGLDMRNGHPAGFVTDHASIALKFEVLTPRRRIPAAQLRNYGLRRQMQGPLGPDCFGLRVASLAGSLVVDGLSRFLDQRGGGRGTREQERNPAPSVRGVAAQRITAVHHILRRHLVGQDRQGRDSKMNFKPLTQNIFPPRPVGVPRLFCSPPIAMRAGSTRRF